MNRIIYARQLAPDIKLFEVQAPKIALRQKAGQFVILRVHQNGERIPITIVDSNPEKGTITIIVQGVGKTTKLLNTYTSGDYIHDVVGPLGKPSPIRNYGTAVCIGGGVGIAEVFPIVRALKKAGNITIAILGARNRELIILEDEIRSICDSVVITTDDGSYGIKGFVTHGLRNLLDEEVDLDYVLAIGPLIMMKAVSDFTRPHNIKTVVSLNPIMVDGTGMCGSCRAIVGGKTVFVCVDGPEFDGHKVDYEILAKRQQMYLRQEKEALDHFFRKQRECRIKKSQPV